MGQYYDILVLFAGNIKWSPGDCMNVERPSARTVGHVVVICGGKLTHFHCICGGAERACERLQTTLHENATIQQIVVHGGGVVGEQFDGKEHGTALSVFDLFFCIVENGGQIEHGFVENGVATVEGIY